MSSKTINNTRRTFLKGAAYASVLSVAGVSSLALVLNKNKQASLEKTALNKETISLTNDSDVAVTLDASFPVIIERKNGLLIAKPNAIGSNSNNGMIIMMPRQTISFDVQTKMETSNQVEIADISKLYEQQLQMASVYPILNKLTPVKNADEIIA